MGDSRNRKHRQSTCAGRSGNPFHTQGKWQAQHIFWRKISHFGMWPNKAQSYHQRPRRREKGKKEWTKVCWVESPSVDLSVKRGRDRQNSALRVPSSRYCHLSVECTNPEDTHPSTQFQYHFYKLPNFYATKHVSDEAMRDGDSIGFGVVLFLFLVWRCRP